MPICCAGPPGLNAIVTGPDGNLWFTDIFTSTVGNITTTGVITQYNTPTANSYPQSLAVAPGNLLWFTEYASGKIATITTAGVITEYPTPTTGSGPRGITTGPGGSIWFIEGQVNKIGEALFETATMSVSPASGAYHSTLTFTGSGFSANETVDIYSSGIGSAVAARATADSNGAFTASAREPLSPAGFKLFLAKGQSSGKIGAANFSVTPRLVTNPSSGAVGSIVTASGFGFGPGENVEVHWDNSQTILGLTSTNISGTFNGSASIVFTVPFGASAGVHTVLAYGQSTKLTARGAFTVQ